MKKTIYNKLIRDKQTEIMAAKGVQCVTEIIPEDDFLSALQEKLYEEVEELFFATTEEEFIYEIADILEVINAIINEKKINPYEIEAAKTMKRQEKGSFSKRIRLLSTEE